jgi:hypothetical protein
MPKRLIEKPVTFDNMLVEAQNWEGGFVVHTPDSKYTSYIDELLDDHFPNRDKTEYLGSEITDADIFRDLLAGEYVTPHDTVVVLEHTPRPAPEATAFIPIKSAFIGLGGDGAEEDRITTIVPIPTLEDATD